MGSHRAMAKLFWLSSSWLWLYSCRPQMGWDTQGTHPNGLQILLLTYPLAVSMLWCVASCAEWTGAPPGKPLLCFTVRA